ncbi:hypothetical protein GT022_11685 [Agaribacter marinus]|uniref:Uncharacterized protein n=1 Tax=Virgibacillus salarius TaxID=447199 RepID=A0A941DT56_9BACI|nr:hypothetical protein [Virgibacillus salarius]MBR7796704.1 hypothetical protein [Virgibacillus salarius]NAZ09414.1 hypothetical protein [Agaribacter marinus]
MKLSKLAVIGLVAGVMLGGILKLIQITTSKQVYTLLLNIDSIPIIKEWNLNELEEFSLHLIVSIILVPILYVVLNKFGRQNQLIAYVISGSMIGLLLYTTTVMSSRTPDITDGMAFFYWMISHMMFGAIAEAFVILGKKNSKE